MAQMIPDSIGQIKETTSGERRVYDILKKTLLPDTDWTVWYDPAATLHNRHGDFLVFSKYHGIILIEVKDWSLSYIENANPNEFIVKDSQGQLLRRQNPLKQARAVQLQIRNLLEKKYSLLDVKASSLLQKSGNHIGRLRFPTTECVIFTNLERAQAEKAGLLDDKILSHNKCLFQDDLRVNLDDKESRAEFVSRLLNSFDYRFSFQPLSNKEVDAVRYALFPEIRVQEQPELDLDVVLNNDELIKVLDKQQEITARSIGPGHRILKGVAGSGKSLVVVYRARHLAKFNPDWKILVVCFNISLRSHLGSSLNNAHIEPYQSKGKGFIEVKHFHDLPPTSINRKKRNNESWDQYNERMSHEMIECLKTYETSGKYDAILIDEGQDFSEGMLQAIVKFLSEKDSLLFCYDPAQNIFERSKFTWKSVGINVQGKKPTLLNKSYRNTRQILELCTEFQGEETETETDNRALVPDYGDCREGDLPLLVSKETFNEMVEYIAQDIKSHVDSGVPLYDFAIIIMESKHKKKIVDNLIPKLEENLKSLGVEGNSVKGILDRDSKVNLDLLHPSIKVLMTDSCKGLEFRNVYFLGLATNEIDTVKLRKTAYVGMSRAKEYLTILYAKPNFYIEELQSILNKHRNDRIF